MVTRYGSVPSPDAETAQDMAMEAAIARAPLSMPRIMGLARSMMPEITTQPVDGIASVERQGTGWRVVVEVIESSARLGDNDLLSAYELELDQVGELTAFRRMRRYHREDRDA